MGVKCVHCNITIPGGLEELHSHLRLRGHAAPFVCAEGDCARRKFHHKTSFIRHLKDHHTDEIQQNVGHSSSAGSRQDSSRNEGNAQESSDDDGDGSSVSDNAPGNILEAAAEAAQEDTPEAPTDNEFEVELQRMAAFFTLNLRRKGNVPGSAVDIVINETASLIQNIVVAVTTKIRKNLELRKEQQLSDDIISDCLNVSVGNPFEHLTTKEKQLAYYKEHFGFIKATPKFLGTYRFRSDFDRQAACSVPRQVPNSFQYISLIDTLTILMQNPIFFHLVHQEKKSTDNCIRSYLDGQLAASHPLISKYPHSLRLVLYGDDYECVNAEGSKTLIHKIAALYYYIQNLPPEENARLRNIHVSVYAYREDIPKEEGINILLLPFFEELAKLESEEGVTISVNGKPYVLRATLIACTGDGLSASEMLGLLGPSANRFCTHCLVTREEMCANIFAVGEKRTKTTHQNHLDAVRNVGQSAKQYYGVSKHTVLYNSKYAEFPEAFMKDTMHDILRGIGPMEIKLALNQFIFVNKYFDVDFLNCRIQSFNYGLADKKNKPSANFTPTSLNPITSYTLRQTAAQTWCFIRVFPFLFANKVPLDDPHLKLIVLLKRMCDVLYSPVISEADLLTLSNVIHDHHSLFFALYPPQQHQAAQDDGDIEEEQGDVQFFDPDDPVNEPGNDVGNEIQPQGRGRRRRKKEKTVRPINKHHNILHYVELIQKYGPLVLYWCMRLEGKHALGKRFAAICCNFISLDLTLADIHQLNHCAEIMDMKCAVRNEIKFSSMLTTTASMSCHFDSLKSVGLSSDDVIQHLKTVTIGGFEYQVNLYVTLPLTVNELPLFGRIVGLYLQDQTVYFVTEDCTVLQYDNGFGAYQIDNDPGPVQRTFTPADLPACRPITAWSAYNSSVLYLSPRNTALAEFLFSLDSD